MAARLHCVRPVVEEKRKVERTRRDTAAREGFAPSSAEISCHSVEATEGNRGP